MTNPNNAVGTDGAYGGRTSVNAFNDNLAQYSRGVLNGWDIAAGGGMSVDMGGNGTDRDVAVAEDNAGNKTTINNISASPINVPIATAHATNDRLDVIVAYVDNPPTGNSTDVDNPGACGIIAVAGIPASTPIAPDDAAIRTAITADGASGSTAYYVVLRTIIVKAGVTVIDSSAWTVSTLVPKKPWAQVQGNRFLADRSVRSEQIGLNQVRSSNIDFTTLDWFSPGYNNVTVSGETTIISTTAQTAGTYVILAVGSMSNSGTTFITWTLKRNGTQIAQTFSDPIARPNVTIITQTILNQSDTITLTVDGTGTTLTRPNGILLLKVSNATS